MPNSIYYKHYVCVIILGIINLIFSFSDAYGLLLCTPERLELGQIECGHTGKGRVTLNNTGTFPVEIKTIRSTCGCVGCVTDTNIIEPGRQVSLQVEVKTDPGKIGQAGAIVFLEINNSEKMLVKIPVTYEVAQSLYAFPQNILLDAVTQNKPCRRCFVLLPRITDDILIKSVQSSDNISVRSFVRMDGKECLSKCVELGLHPSGSSWPYGYLVELEIDSKQNGPLNESLNIVYEIPDKSAGILIAKVLGTIVPDVYLEPSILRLGRLDPDSKIVRMVRIISNDRKDFTIKSIRSNGNLNIAHQTIHKTDEEYNLQMAITPNSQVPLTEGNYHSTVEIILELAGENHTLNLQIVGCR